MSNDFVLAAEKILDVKVPVLVDGRWHSLNEKRHRRDPTAIMAVQMAAIIAGRCKIL
jgi:hypothetical protein